MLQRLIVVLTSDNLKDRVYLLVYECANNSTDLNNRSCYLLNSCDFHSNNRSLAKIHDLILTRTPASNRKLWRQMRQVEVPAWRNIATIARRSSSSRAQSPANYHIIAVGACPPRTFTRQCMLKRSLRAPRLTCTHLKPSFEESSQ